MFFRILYLSVPQLFYCIVFTLLADLWDTKENDFHLFWYFRIKCKVGENAILGLSKAEMVRNACFYIELVSFTYGLNFS